MNPAAFDQFERREIASQLARTVECSVYLVDRSCGSRIELISWIVLSNRTAFFL